MNIVRLLRIEHLCTVTEITNKGSTHTLKKVFVTFAEADGKSSEQPEGDLGPRMSQLGVYWKEIRC